MALTCKIGTTVPLKRIVDEYVVSTYQQDSQKYIATFMIFANRVYQELQFNILRSQKKLIMNIDLTTATVNLPADVLYWEQVSIIDDNDNVVALIEKDAKLLDYEEEIVASACANPACNTDICSGVKSITAVSEVVTFDYPATDTEYTNVVKTQLQPDGSLIKETCKWYAVYDDDAITDVVKRCTTEEICKLELTDDGCVAATASNIATVNTCCDYCSPVCEPSKLLPTIEVWDNVIHFSNTNYDRIVLTYKTSGINFGMEIMVPELAIPAMLSGIYYHAVKYKRVSVAEKENARKTYNIDKNKVVKMLNPIREQEFLDARYVRVLY